MEAHIKTGRVGEEIALRYLESKNYIIHERNWRHARREVDIIAQEGGDIVFVEVKTRHSSPWGRAVEAVDAYQRQRLVEAANAYVRQRQLNLSVRFDIIGINIQSDGTYNIEHAERAFYPTLQRPRRPARRPLPRASK